MRRALLSAWLLGTWAYIRADASSMGHGQEEDALLRALEVLEKSRSAWLQEMRQFAARRRAEKALGRRSPRKDDLKRTYGVWPSMRKVWWPRSLPLSTEGLLWAVAAEYAVLKEEPFPARARGQELGGVDLVLLDAQLAGCISSYLGFGGRLQGSACEILTACTNELRSIVLHLGKLDDPMAYWYFRRLLKVAELIEEGTSTRLDGGSLQR